jgi:ABC-2 type transport system ATP-binding protein
MTDPHPPSTGAPAILTEGLGKRYGPRPIVRDLSFRVSPGEVYALVGPNGAGKTTVIRLVSGLAFPSEGRVRMLGKNPHEHPEVRRRLGAVVEAPAAFYPYLSGRANLRLHARLAGGAAEERIEELLELMELGSAADRKVGVYSLGMRQRLGVAGALLTRPDVLILDEPASGMDPLSLHLVHRVLQNAAGRGSAVLLSTHHLDEVAAYCNRVGIMEEGALIDEVDLDRRRDRYRARVDDPQTARTALLAQPWVQEAFLRAGRVIFQLADADALARVAPLLTQNGVALLELSEDTFDLRSYYRERVAAERQRRTVEPGSVPDAGEPSPPPRGAAGEDRDGGEAR